MIDHRVIALIIPAHNEGESIVRVITAVPDGVDRILVVDNRSNDGTGDKARAAGAEVVHEDRLGYGTACLAGIEALKANPPDIVTLEDLKALLIKNGVNVTRPVVYYCTGGIRSGFTWLAHVLSGLPGAVNFEGGTEEWKAGRHLVR